MRRISVRLGEHRVPCGLLEGSRGFVRDRVLEEVTLGESRRRRLGMGGHDVVQTLSRKSRRSGARVRDAALHCGLLESDM